MQQINPFLIEGYISPEYFCDRVAETALLKEHLLNQRNVALVAKRRLGKSGLIQNCFYSDDIRQNFYTFYVDIYDTKNLAEFTYELGRGILDALKPFGKKVWEGFVLLLKSLKTGITFDMNGTPEWNVSMGELQMPDILLDEIFAYLESADRPCLVAIDEFQVIADYPEKTVEATLRKRIQNCHNVRFVYSGSKRHMMAEMFASNSRPFYNSAVLMGLDPIDPTLYEEFANHHLHGNQQAISHEAFVHLFNRFDGVTWYIQYVLNMLYAHKTQNIIFEEQDVENTVLLILQRNAFAYRSLLFQLAPKQKEVLRAIAKEGKVQGIMSKQFLRTYHLTSSTVQGAVKALVDRDFITNEDDVYYVHDHFFSLWLSHYA